MRQVGSGGASLDVMRRDRAATAWHNGFLVVEAARSLPELGIRRLSLGSSFLRAVLARWLLGRLSGPFQIETLYHFNRKSQPALQPRYLAVESPGDLPRVALAAPRAEGLLSLPWRLRGPRRARGDSR
jgi:lysyl-tRNA synthetase class 2